MPAVPVPDLASFRELPLPGGFVLDSIAAVPGPLIDPIGRAALARTTIHAGRIAIVLDEQQSAEDQSISIYHELIEGLTVAVPIAPGAVMEFSEADFEREARRAFDTFGVATPTTVITFLTNFGFR